MGRASRPKYRRKGKSEYSKVQPSPRAWKPFHWDVILASVLVFLTLAAYGTAMQGGFVWDDDYYVSQNQTLRSSKGLAQIWLEPESTPQYYPVVFTSFWVEYHVWGLDPFGYHVVNVILHAVNAVLLWLILRRLTVPGAWLAAALFAVHPVHVESVAWITERKNVLSGLFYFSSAICLLGFFGLNGERRDQSPQRVWYGAALLLFVGALLSKSVTSSLPAAAILVLWWKRGRVSWQELRALLPFFIMGLTSALWTVWLERHHVGAQGLEWDLSLLERLLVAGRALWFYAGKLVLPLDLTFTYPRWQIDAGLWWQYAYPAGAAVAIAVLWAFRSRLGRGPVTGLLYVCVTLFPALGFFDIYPFRFSYVADHFQYLASVGLIVLVVATLSSWASRLPSLPREVGMVSKALLLVTLSTLTWRQGYIYKDMEALWTDTLRKNPTSWHRHYDLATILARQGRTNEAINHFAEALKIKPDYADAHNNFALTLWSQGKVTEAIKHFTEVLQIDPNHGEAHYNLALLLHAQGKSAEAIEHLEEHLRISPDHADAHYNLGVILAEDGRLEEAARHFSEVLRLKPDYAAARRNLELAQRLMGKSPSLSSP